MVRQSFKAQQIVRKIGVFSDVHGHVEELRQTFMLFEAHDVDDVICAGDLVDKGTQSQAVIALMMISNIMCVQGNHDAKALRGWLANDQRLSIESLNYLSNLPRQLTLHWIGCAVFLCHSTPWHDPSVYVFPDRPTALFRYIAEATPADVIVLGHTHHPMRVHINDKVILNPGSIYGNRDRAERTCGILTLPQKQFDLFDIDTGQIVRL